MSLSAPQSPRGPSTPSEPRSSVSPSLLRIPNLVPDRARSLTPSRSTRAIRIRKRLPQYATIEDAADLLFNAENIVVVAGAGISTCVGIPDFRSAEGLYNQVGNKRNFQDPQTLFETDTFLSAPQEFWEDVKPIIPKLTTAINTSTAIVETVPKYGPVHAFLNLLQSKDKLLTVFTQNIDGLELAAGVAERKTIKCHGSWDSATCITCKGKVGANGYLPVVYAGLLPLCSCAMSTTPNATTVVRRGSRARKGTTDADANVQYIDTHGGRSQTTSSQLSPRKTSKKRRREDLDDDSGAADPVGRPGLIKPDITFFGEDISTDFKPRFREIINDVDLLLIIGTSLPVVPLNLMPLCIPASIPQIWISNEWCKREGLAVDVELKGDCGLVVEELCRLTGWTNGLLNRLWRNNLGSTLQAKEAMKARADKAVATMVKNDPNPVKSERFRQLPLRQAVSPEPGNAKKERKVKQDVEKKVRVEQLEGFPSRSLVQFKLKG